MDVLMSLSTGQAPINRDPLLPNAIHPPGSISSPAIIDEVFGFSSQLWPTLHRLARAAHSKHLIGAESGSGGESSDLTRPFVEVVENLEAEKLEIAGLLQQWSQPEPTERASVAESRRHQGLIDHAEAYRAAGLIYLYRELYELEPSTPEVQRPAKIILEACQRILAGMGPTVGLLWPLFIAATNLIDDVDIVSARGAFSDLAMQRRTNNISVAWKACEQIWMRRGRGIREVHWRQDPSEAIVFG